MIKKLAENVWQIAFRNFGSCVYIVKIENKTIMIDAGSPETIQELAESLKELKILPEEVDTIILTHFHYDHVAGLLLFPNAKVYGSKKDFGENLIDISQLNIPEFKIIETPGHSKGGICILYKDILFSGDTIFHHGMVGRTDLPGGDYNELKDSIKKLDKIKYKLLAPGHI